MEELWLPVHVFDLASDGIAKDDGGGDGPGDDLGRRREVAGDCVGCVLQQSRCESRSAEIDEAVEGEAQAGQVDGAETWPGVPRHRGQMRAKAEEDRGSCQAGRERGSRWSRRGGCVGRRFRERRRRWRSLRRRSRGRARRRRYAPTAGAKWRTASVASRKARAAWPVSKVVISWRSRMVRRATLIP